MQLPERFRNRRSVIALIAGGVVVAVVGVWFLVAVLAPAVEDAPCASASFRAPVKSVPGPEGTPPIGGDGGLAGKVRSLFSGGAPVVYCDDFADPFVLRDADSYYAYSTNTDEDHVPVLTSGGLFGTAQRHDVLPDLPAWSAPSYVWAPGLLARPGGYVLFYTTRPKGSTTECLSYALGKEPGGPFVDSSTGPFVCPAGGGAIDPNPFVDANGRVYLLWKNYGSETGIMAQELAADGTSLVGPATLIAHADQAWEAGVVEAPTMLAQGGRYYLFYSGNDWNTASYAVSYAVCTSPLGPCTKPDPGPWLTSSPTAQGPGSPSVFTDEQGSTWLALHSWVGGKVGYPDGARNLFVVQFAIVNGQPFLT